MISISEYKIINVNLFRPAFNNVKQRCEVLSCNACDSCELYKSGNCVFNDQIFSRTNCIHSRFNSEEGYTKRARSYYSWFEKKQQQYGVNLVDAIKTGFEKLCIVGGDYVFLPYPFFDNYSNPLKWVEKGHFVSLEKFNSDAIYEICTYKPRALFGNDEITDFQKKHVPKFLQDLKEVMPELYDDFLTKYPAYKEIAEKHVKNFIGRKAKIATLKDGSIVRDCHHNGWEVKEGKLVCDQWKTWLPFGKTPTKTEITITDDMTYDITDNDMVTDKTVLVD